MIAAGTWCWLTNAHPGLKVGTASLLLEDASQERHNEVVRVRTDKGERGVTSLSLVPMLPEEIPDSTVHLTWWEDDQGQVRDRKVTLADEVAAGLHDAPHP